MEELEISLIYPDKESLYRAGMGKDRVNVSRNVIDEIELSYILDLKNSLLTEFFTTDPKVVTYRQSVFTDMLENPELSKVLLKVMPILNDITELRRLSTDSGSTESYLYSITEIELYTSCMELLRDGLVPMRNNLKSTAFVALADRIKELTESEYYSELNKKLGELTSRVREIKSITVGVNLDAQLRPEHAGVLSINNEQFKSGDVIDKILRLSFKNDEYTCIASLVPFRKNQSENQQMALDNAFNSAINEVFKASVRSWRRIIQTYVLENTDFLIRLMPEIEFVVKGTELIRTLKEKGNVLCFPKMAPWS